MNRTTSEIAGFIGREAPFSQPSPSSESGGDEARASLAATAGGQLYTDGSGAEAAGRQPMGQTLTSSFLFIRPRLAAPKP